MKMLISILIMLGLSSYLFANDNSSINIPHIFASGDVISSSKINNNFAHIAKQFGHNKITVDCNSGNLINEINNGYNHLSVRGNCSSSITTSFIDLELLGYSPDHKSVGFLTLSGRDREIDSVTGFIKALSNSVLQIDNLTIHGNFDINAGGFLLLNNVKVIGNILVGGGAFVIMNNSSIDGSSSSTECLKIEQGAYFFGANVNISCSVNNNTVTLTQSNALLKGDSNIITASGNAHAFKVEYGSSLIIGGNTEVSSETYEAMVIVGSVVRLSGNSTTSVLSTDSEYDISLNAFSYLIIDSGVTTGTVRCKDALTFVDNRTGSTATVDTSCTQ